MNLSRYQLHERISRVKSASATDDVLVTVAVPPDASVGEALERVEEDRAEAEYIDPDEASQPLRRGLERTRRVLQNYEETPENGLVVYAGVVDGDVTEYVFDDLPTPVSEFRYVTANEFDAEPLDAARESSGTYGLVVVERGGAALGTVTDEELTVVETIDSDVPGKTKAGGQSAERFERERERQKESFFDSVAEAAERAFLGDGRAASGGGKSDGGGNGDGGVAAADSATSADTAGDSDDGDATAVDGLLLGGTTVTVEEFRDEGHLDHRLENALVGDAYAVEYASEQGLGQLAEKGSDAIENEERREMREALDRFFDGLDEADGEVVYGRADVDEALTYDAVETLLVSADRRAERVSGLAERVEAEGGELLVVPTDFERGERFDEAFDGVGALLRFPVE